MDDHITESISKDKKNQLNLSAPLKKIANKKYLTKSVIIN